MHRRMIRVLVATATVAGIATAGAAPALAAPTAAPAVIAESGSAGTGSAGTGSALIDFPLGIMKLIICGPWGAAEPHPNPMCR
ncbi:hypothetical protein NN3_16900 [Nocardia neocaledoniensis NBRC 108232]|uniref:Uncharacterized protein n=2 Tax=Nocardia neocaledoniensis TaxID=236511 RepID=A0A317NNF4_9NOCA|nr:hypothetical protein DFR69_104146 [Nocardia neocaledoniensis]GEM30683.1 hypothetical protein NN3_16900 [Nocardia neocaledoniensis NBRC 108232]